MTKLDYLRLTQKADWYLYERPTSFNSIFADSITVSDLNRHPNLQMLSFNKLEGKLENLTSKDSIIALGGNGKNILHALHHFPNLKYLYLEGRFSEFPKEILNLANLTHLYLDSINSEDLGAIINFPNLVDLNIKFYNQSIVPAQIFEISRLSSLFINCKEMELIPTEIVKLKSLKCLAIRSKMVSSLPFGFEDLDQIENLGLDLRLSNENMIKLGKLKKLNFLEINTKDSWANPNISLLNHVSSILIENCITQKEMDFISQKCPKPVFNYCVRDWE